jgi:hypothetical protein
MGKHNIFKTIDKALLGMILFMSVQVQAQNNKDDTLNTKDIVPDRVPSTSLFVELGGKFFPSVNVDYRP